jgi:hypothetical protein
VEGGEQYLATTLASPRCRRDQLLVLAVEHRAPVEHGAIVRDTRHDGWLAGAQALRDVVGALAVELDAPGSGRLRLLRERRPLARDSLLPGGITRRYRGRP